MGVTIYNASAGSGKTHLLTHLIAEMINGDHSVNGIKKTDPTRVIATTFTKTAAKEIKERVSSVLIEKGMFEEAAQIQSSLLGTVNSICGALLEKYAAFSGNIANIKVIEQDDSEQLISSFISSCIEDNLLDFAQFVGWGEYYNEGKMVDGLTPKISGLINQFRANCITEIDSEKLFERLYKKSLDTYTKEELLEKLKVFWRDFSKNCAYFEEINGSPATYNKALIQLKKTFLSKGEFRKILTANLKAIKSVEKFPKGFVKCWKGLDKNEAEVCFENEIKGLIEDLELASCRKVELEEFVKSISNIVSNVLVEYNAHKKEKGLIDFIDQEVMLLELLKNSELVREDIKASYDVAFVDEFQDTSPIQLNIFTELNKLISHSVWIGDPKQSIYGFRGADFNMMKNLLNYVESQPNLQGVLKQKDHQLKTSYRSRKELVNFSNVLFKDVFEGLEENRVLLNADTTRKTYNSSTPIHFWTEKESRGKKLNPENLAKKIRSILENEKDDFTFYPKNEDKPRAIQAGDICFLTRTNGTIDDLAKAFIQAGLKVNAPMKGLPQCLEVFCLLSIMKLLKFKNDKLSTLEVSLVLNGGDVNSSIEKILTNNLNWNEIEVADFVNQLLDYKSDITRMSFSDQLNFVVNASSYTKRLVGLDNPFQAKNNILKLLKYAQTFEERCLSEGKTSSLLKFETFLNDTETEQSFISHPECVNIMTYHKSKGLEFPMVIMMDLHKDIFDCYGTEVIDKNNSDASVGELAERTVNILLKDPLLNTDIKEVGDNKEASESQRLMYVGLTRARDFIVFPFRENNNNNYLNLFSLAVNDKLTSNDIPKDSREFLLQIGDKEFETNISQIDNIFLEEKSKSILNEVMIPEYGFNKTNSTKFLTGSGSELMNSSNELKYDTTQKIKVKVNVNYDFINQIPENQFGDAVHNGFFQIAKGDNQVAQNVVSRWGAQEIIKDINDIQEVYNEVKLSIEKQYGTIENILLEHSFSFFDEGQLLSGVMDLVFLTKSGWVVVDYKSHFSPKTDLQKHSEKYISQLSNYGNAIDSYLDRPFASAVIAYPVLGKLLFFK